MQRQCPSRFTEGDLLFACPLEQPWDALFLRCVLGAPLEQPPTIGARLRRARVLGDEGVERRERFGVRRAAEALVLEDGLVVLRRFAGAARRGGERPRPRQEELP